MFGDSTNQSDCILPFGRLLVLSLSQETDEDVLSTRNVV